MKAAAIRTAVTKTLPPMNFYNSDGNIIYVDHPESVLVGDGLVAIDPGANGTGHGSRELILLSPDHIVRIERTKRKALRRIAKRRR